MKKTANIAIENKDEAAGRCPACERTGLPVFLLRQAVIKTKFIKIEEVNRTYQELADYTKTLNFKHRMPEDTLEYYDYVLRTLRNGYVYVMQQQGDDIESRILNAYECIDGALRLKDAHELPHTQPRPLSKACKNACHTIPASFINLDDKRFTQAWVAYSSQPWSKKTFDDYLKEQDSNALSRFTKIDIQNLKDSPSDATGKRAVPFKDIFGSSYESYQNENSKVLEFRFDKHLDNFESAHPFTSLKDQKLKYVLHTHQLYQGGKPISCGIVLEDTLGIAEELNSQRVSKLHIFCSDVPKQQVKPLASFDDDEAKVYQQRGEQMYNHVNPTLKRWFKYYQADMFKKRTILQFIENYRTSIEDAYDTEIARLQEHYDYLKDIDAAYDSGEEFLRKVEYEIKEAESEKAKKIEKINQHINHGEVEKFKGELETEFEEITRYYQEWSQDYFTYVRWLFGEAKFISQYSKIKPTSFNQNHFWQKEFDFSNDTSA
ncbi:toxin VasX, partial [Gilliamella mensalis]|uniref:toxin VasX n=1 Tax=Gilliamella mensalis TaxID=1908520 RepID=UPI001428D4D8